MKEERFVKGFYCRYCGSTTAIYIDNLKKIRCMGCDLFFREGDDFVPTKTPLEALQSRPLTALPTP